MRQTCAWLSVALLVAACTVDNPRVADDGGVTPPAPDAGPQEPPQVDILFVVDNSNSMGPKLQALTAGFPTLLATLRHPKLAGGLPDLRIGVVSSDLGAGSYIVPTCAAGDGGKLLNRPRKPGCATPRDPWISYAHGVTNIDAGAADPSARVAEGFSCIADLGTSGCGFEQPLQAARLALEAQTNPGFLRPQALLAVIFVTDEDDCSVEQAQLLDPTRTAEFGPLSSFRCTEFGLICDQPLRATGAKTNCRPGQAWLRSVDSYASFFAGLKPAGRVVVAALAGPADPVAVAQETKNNVTSWSLTPSCDVQGASARMGIPALRLKSVVSGIGADGMFNEGLEASGALSSSTICSASHDSFFRLVGQRLLSRLAI